MSYTVKYKLPGQRFWRKIKQVKGDGFMFDFELPLFGLSGHHLLSSGDVAGAKGLPKATHRWFILADESRVEVPLAQTQFRFGPQRFFKIQAETQQEAGRSL